MTHIVKSFKQMIKGGEIKRADAMRIKLDDIYEESGFNLREEGEDLNASIEALTDHIMTGGMVPAMEVRPRAAGGVYVVDGHRRRRAFILARERGAPIEWILVVGFTGNDADRIARVITSAEGRSLTPVEVARGYKRLSGLGLMPEDIAKLVNKTRQHVDQLLILSKSNTDVQKLVASGSVSAAVAVKMVRTNGEGAGAMLQKELDKAKAAGKSKVTPGTIAGKKNVKSQLVDELIFATDTLCNRLALESESATEWPAYRMAVAAVTNARRSGK